MKSIELIYHKFNQNMQKILITFLFCLLSSPLWAVLSWETTEITRKVGLLEKKATYVFRFMNVGDVPLTISEIKPDCGCTTAELAKKTYQPTETGEIVVTFDIGSRQGLQTKKIRVKTDVEGDSVSTLVTKTIIPKLLEITPKVTFWDHKSSPEPKVITVTTAEEYTIAIESAESNNPDFTLDLESLDKNAYQITVFPTKFEKGNKATIALKTNYPKHDPKTYFFYVYVK